MQPSHLLELVSEKTEGFCDRKTKFTKVTGGIGDSIIVEGVQQLCPGVRVHTIESHSLKSGNLDACTDGFFSPDDPYAAKCKISAAQFRNIAFATYFTQYHTNTNTHNFQNRNPLSLQTIGRILQTMSPYRVTGEHLRIYTMGTQVTPRELMLAINGTLVGLCVVGADCIRRQSRHFTSSGNISGHTVRWLSDPLQPYPPLCLGIGLIRGLEVDPNSGELVFYILTPVDSRLLVCC